MKRSWFYLYNIARDVTSCAQRPGSVVSPSFWESWDTRTPWWKCERAQITQHSCNFIFFFFSFWPTSSVFREQCVCLHLQVLGAADATEREWGLNWNSCQPATNMLNEYNKIKPLTVVTPSRVPWCSCSRDCPMSWDCLGGNPGAKLVLESYGIISSTSLQQKGGLQPPLKSSYQEVGCAVGWCAGFQRNQSLKEGFFGGSLGAKKEAQLELEQAETRGALWMLVLALGGQQTCL